MMPALLSGSEALRARMAAAARRFAEAGAALRKVVARLVTAGSQTREADRRTR
jgi:hypothetical protein